MALPVRRWARMAGLAVCALAARSARAQTEAPAGGTEAPAGEGAAPSGGEGTPAAPSEGAPAEPPPGGDTGGGLFEQGLSAAPSATSAAPASEAGGFKLNGYTRGDIFVGKETGASKGEMKADYGELSLIARTPKSPYGDGFAEARIRYGLQGDQQQVFLDLREAYVNMYLGPLDLRIGQQIVVWGRADALNPTNNLTPVDFNIRSPLEDDIRLGNAGARAFLRFHPFRLEGVWMPIYLPTVLPPVGLPMYVSFGPPTFPSPELTNGTVGGRLHLELPSFEMSLSYVHGYAPLPGITLPDDGVHLTAMRDMVTGVVTQGDEPPSIIVSRTAYQQQVFGFDFSTALGDVMTLRGEAAYRKPYNYQNTVYGQVPFPDAQYVVGVDHNFGSLSIILQYMGRYVFDWQKQSGPAMSVDPSTLLTKTMDDLPSVVSIITAQLQKTNQILFSQTAQLQHIATLRFEWLGLHDTLSISSLCLYNFTTKEWVVTPRIGWRLSDALMAYLGAQIFYGPQDTLFGLIDSELSAGYVELRYTF